MKNSTFCMLTSPPLSPSSPHQQEKFAACVSQSIPQGAFVSSIIKVTPRAWLNVTSSLGRVTKMPTNVEMESFKSFKSGKPSDNK